MVNPLKATWVICESHMWMSGGEPACWIASFTGTDISCHPSAQAWILPSSCCIWMWAVSLSELWWMMRNIEIIKEYLSIWSYNWRKVIDEVAELDRGHCPEGQRCLVNEMIDLQPPQPSSFVLDRIPATGEFSLRFTSLQFRQGFMMPSSIKCCLDCNESYFLMYLWSSAL